ncbi:MAG: hypothetical protein JKY52_09145 [Flavobacteriales bacterium]|nr:hypothetical protein [Flavobacteriales bacterium]
MNKYNSESYAAEAHKPAKRAKEGDRGLLLPTEQSGYDVQGCLAGPVLSGRSRKVFLFDKNRTLVACPHKQLLSIEPTLAIKAEPDYLLMVEQINKLKKS